jgi:hypothetical protein
MTPRPVEVMPMPKYHIWLQYSDGAEGVVDLAHLAGKGVFKDWERPGAFENVYIAEHGAVAWSDEIELCPDALYLSMTGMTPEELF